MSKGDLRVRIGVDAIRFTPKFVPSKTRVLQNLQIVQQLLYKVVLFSRER